MVNPITSHPAATPFGPIAADIERPVSLPEPAVQVTAAAETASGRDAAATRNQAGGPGEGEHPLDKALEALNASMKAWSTSMRFDVDPEAQRIVVSIVDSESGEVLRTVPTDAVIRVAKMIVQLQGKSVDTRV